MLSPSGPPSSQRYENHIRRGHEEYVLISGTQALEGKDVKELLLNVGSGGGAAAAPAAGGAAGGEAAAEEAKPEEKEEGKKCISIYTEQHANTINSQRGVRRGYGFRSFRLNALKHFLSELTNAWHGSLRCGIWLVE